MKFVWISLGVVILFLAGGSWWVLNTVNHATGDKNATVSITINTGAGVRDISVSLYKDKLIRSAQAWTLYVILTGSRSDIHNGSYVLNRAMTGRDILHVLTTNPSDERQVEVTILEGWTNKEIANKLEQAGVISAQDFLAAAGTTDSRTILPDTTYDFLSSKPSSVDLEGFLFPDTYKFFKHSTKAQVIKKFLDNFDQRYNATMRQDTIASGHTITDIVIMASILEKELKTDSDRKNGADVFWKRIAAGMPLQSNATILYAMGTSEDNLSVADTKFVSPYNTYLHAGLPPGPINNPGLKTMLAALHPTPNPYYYFLSSRSTGITYFAKTLEEHNQNKVKYLQ